MKSKTIQEISMDDWDELVQKTYNRPYSVQQTEGCYENESSIPFRIHGNEKDTGAVDAHRGSGVSLKEWLERDPTEPFEGQRHDWELTMFWEQTFYPRFHELVYDLACRGLLAPGEYRIQIYW